MKITAVSLAAVIAALLAISPAGAGTPTPGANPAPLVAWDAFKKANDSIKDYTETLTSHEIKNGRTEDRVYHFSFAKPSSARSEVISGPGSGGVAVWNGGVQVRGHKGGMLSMIKLTLSIDDPRVTDLRGKTIDAAFYPTMIAGFETDGKLSESPGDPVDGSPTDEVTYVPNDPSKLRNLTKDVLVISRTTHLPVEHRGYEGTQLVEDEHFTELKINPDLSPATFQM